ncbi:MAG: EAL domain-containing response regulator [Myxococcota bacterium]|nr:EAL domain-containing response regulator [Myxococcota bacterium]MDW8363914.1 EAL domain-containing response regulator [Myxococcales bacterium]
MSGAAASDASAPGATAGRAEPHTRGTILLVDDDSVLLRAYRRALEGAGYEVMCAVTGQEALECLRTAAVDAILTDILMPGMDGVELLREVKRTHPDLAVVLTTGGPTVETAIAALDHGAFRYLVKPVEARVLVEVLGRAVKLSRLAAVKREALALLDERDARLHDRAGLEAAFDRALQGLYVVYQPIVEWRTRSVYGYECLVRNTEPTFPHPGALFDAADKLGRLRDLGARIRDLAPQPFDPTGLARLFLNLHPTDLGDERLFASEHPLARMAERVVLEVTERNSLERVPDARHRIARLRGLGFRVAVDDLGAGYAGLSSFALLEPDVAKLDMAIVRDVHRSPMRQKLIRSMADLCRDMGIVLVAEGVECREELEVLCALGCDLFQGFYFARPGKPFPEPRLD